ncbi:VirB4 family type IV secretion/conjugal transfer ATPase [Caenibius sp. WL]|uniref:VirB4 family type IV secretion/conjugal transfer ATPase n=1 Tax=Caenibius sp. WL TaxID=2872646 RepID=UPI001E7A9C80|nr:VirB4 family type IV secretion/conjugal transfer ATPase [Caenibius sp. WL]QZP09770.1 VirB4 family type IV secretion/conjugal transfer ATPase [Caenibius sp. WL]
MQFLSPLNHTQQNWQREKPAGNHLPYLAQIDDHTVMLRDGRLMQVIAIEGLLFETADTSELNYRKALREAMIQAIGSSRFALYHHIIRRRVEPRLDASFPDPFSQELDSVWQARLSAKQLFTNDLFLCIIRRPLQGRGKAVDRLARMFGKATQAGRIADLASERRALDAACDALLAALSEYGARRLGAYEGKGGLCSEPIEYLSALYNGEFRPVLAPSGDVGHHLPYRRVSFGARTVELGPTDERKRDFLGIIAIKEYPGQSSPGMLDDLMRLPFELVMTQSFAFVDRQTALGRMNLALRRMRAADDEALSLRDELVVARDELAASRAAFGEHHLTIAVRGDSEEEVDDGVAEVQAALTDLGIIAVREEMALEPSFWAQFPGNFSYIPRRGMVASRNFASFASMHNFPVGRREDNHWGQAVTVLETTAGGPYYFNFHHGDLGNFTVIGPSGSGKTVVVNFLIAQARKFNPRIVLFDKDRGAELFLRAIGGRYNVLRVGEPSGLNPLLLEDNPENRRFLVDWLSLLVTEPGIPLSAEEAARIKDAVDANMEAPLAYRRLGHFAQLLRGEERPRAGDLAARLAPWWGTGERAWLFDNADDLVDLTQSVVGFDMTRILDDAIVRTPAMMYLFHRVEQRLDGTPSIIVVDEGWKALDDEVFTARIRDWEKTIRKRNGIVGFVTQSAEDALESRIASAIVEQAATQIFMANPKAQARDYMTGFGLTQHEYDLVRSLPDSAHAFLIKHGKESVVARLDLSGNKKLMMILSGREQTVRLLDAIRAETGDAPEDWLHRLEEAAE